MAVAGMAPRPFPLTARHFAMLYWVAVACAVMPGVAFLKPVEFFAVGIVAATITCALFFPRLRAPVLFVCVMLFPRTIEMNPAWSDILSFREPAKDVRIMPVLSLLDVAIVVTALAVLLPKPFRREPILSHGRGWGLAFVGVYLCSVLLSAGRFGGPWDAEFVAVTNLMRVLLVWLVFVNGETGEGHARGLTFAFFACGLIACISGLDRYLFAGPMSATEAWEARAVPFNMNANSFAATMLMMGLMGMALLCLARQRWERWLGLPITGLAVAGEAVSLSRAGIGLFALLAAWMLFRHRPVLLLIWLGVLGLGAVAVMATPEVNGRIALFQTGASVMEDQVRAQVYHQSLEMVRDNWLLGIGPYRYFDASVPYIPTGIARNVAHSHSLPLQVIVDTGVFGMLFALLLLSAWVRRARRVLQRPLSDNAWRVGAAYAFVAALIYQCVDSLYLDYRFAVAWFATMAILLTAPSRREPTPGSEKSLRPATAQRRSVSPKAA